LKELGCLRGQNKIEDMKNILLISILMVVTVLANAKAVIQNAVKQSPQVAAISFRAATIEFNRPVSMATVRAHQNSRKVRRRMKAHHVAALRKKVTREKIHCR